MILGGTFIKTNAKLDAENVQIATSSLSVAEGKLEVLAFLPKKNAR